jgi:hypothetical protein
VEDVAGPDWGFEERNIEQDRIVGLRQKEVGDLREANPLNGKLSLCGKCGRDRWIQTEHERLAMSQETAELRRQQERPAQERVKVDEERAVRQSARRENQGTTQEQRRFNFARQLQSNEEILLADVSWTAKNEAWLHCGSSADANDIRSLALLAGLRCATAEPFRLNTAKSCCKD